MIENNEIRHWLTHTLFQSIAELCGNDLISSERFTLAQLLKSSAAARKSGAAEGVTERFLGRHQRWFDSDYQLVVHGWMANARFSATVFASREAHRHEYAISFRSDEYRWSADGGPWQRGYEHDAAWVLGASGFALPQLAAMEKFFGELTAGRTYDAEQAAWTDSANPCVQRFAADWRGQRADVTVTGYALGGHLATAFTLLHWPRVSRTYTYNSAGIGGFRDAGGEVIAPDRKRLLDLIDRYNTLMAWDGDRGAPWFVDMSANARTHAKELAVKFAKFVSAAGKYPGTVAQDHARNLYQNPKYEAVIDWLVGEFAPVGVGPGGTGTVDAALRSLQRMEAGFDAESLARAVGSADEWTDKITQLNCHRDFFRSGIARADGSLPTSTFKPRTKPSLKQAG